MVKYTDKFFYTRMHTELCKLATDITGKLHTTSIPREDLIKIIKEHHNVH